MILKLSFNFCEIDKNSGNYRKSFFLWDNYVNKIDNFSQSQIKVSDRWQVRDKWLHAR